MDFEESLEHHSQEIKENTKLQQQDYDDMDELEKDSDDWEELLSVNNHIRTISVDPGQKPIRIDRYLQEKLPNVSRNRVQAAIAQERVFVNKKPVKSSYRVKPFDRIRLELPDAPMGIGIIPEEIPLNIVYEDNDLLVINKPPNMVVHPGYNNWTGTLVNALAYYFDNLPTSHNGDDKPGIVHRIDKDTSGLMVVAKTEIAMKNLAKQFHDHTCERTYYAIVWGHVDKDKDTIIGNIGRDPRDRRLRTVYKENAFGKHAITHYQVVRRLRYVSLVKCNLETGRTHQIRVHMKYIGHRLFQDQMYGGDRILKGERTAKYRTFVESCFKALPRQALHAKSLGFKHPTTGEWMQFECDLPDDFQQALTMWEGYVTAEDEHL